jgi:uncharacterized protein YjiS (DUF1127 family)/mono/diheme cytochrome c family protein
MHPITIISGAASRLIRRPVPIGRALGRIILARATRRALNGLPDALLADIGLTRGDLPFVIDMVKSEGDFPRDALHRRERAATSAAVQHRPPRIGLRAAVAAMVSISVCVALSSMAFAQDARVGRGKYLVTLGGCTDCHTPGYFFGKPDMARYLGGSEVGFEIPGLGVFHGPNLTPDQETGLGKWSAEEIGKAITAGERPDGRILAPIMPWHAFANLTGEDVGAIVAFLKSLPPVRNKVPGPFGPSEKPGSFVMKIVPPDPAAIAGPAPK